MTTLIVRSPFADYKVGDSITDADLVTAIMADSRAHYVTPTEDDSSGKSEPQIGDEK